MTHALLVLPLAVRVTLRMLASVNHPLCCSAGWNLGWSLRVLTVWTLLWVLVGAARLLLPAGQRQLPLQVDQQEVEGGLLRDQHGHQPHALGGGHEPQRRLCGPGVSALCVYVASTRHGCTLPCS